MKTNREKYYFSIAQKVIDQENRYQEMSDDELKEQTVILRNKLMSGTKLDDLLVPAFATIREADYRVLGMKPFFNQVLGAVALYFNNVAEMKTGEGKTLTATMPMYLYGLTGPGNFLITSNTYLAQRDGKDIGRVYLWLGLTIEVGVATSEFEESARDKEKIYQADIVYTTNSALGFDYLFDNLASNTDEQYIKKFNFALIDEIDAVLLDMAQTPLLISGAPRVQSNLYTSSDRMIQSLKKDIDFEQSDDLKRIWFTTTGIEHIEEKLGITGLLEEKWTSVYRHLLLALRANYLFLLNRDYVVEGGQLILLDKVNGRKLGGTKLQAGLHQAIEAKEHIEVSLETRAMASVTYQNLFRMFAHLSGMTGTASTDKHEFFETYGLDVIKIPTHKPIARIDHPDKVYLSNEAKIFASLDDVKEAHAIGRPILIETGSVSMSELYSRILLREGLSHTLLNAMSVAKEASIIQLAGQKNAITVATSMAGRGTDIKLGDGVEELGGLLVIGTERMANARVDNQLRGRSGRQGSVGESVFYVSLEDKLVLENGGKRINRFRRNLTKKLSGTNKANEELSTSRIALKAVTKAQNVQKNQEIMERFQTLEYDQVLKSQRDILYKTRNKVIDAVEYGTVIDQAILSVSLEMITKKTLTEEELSDFYYNNVAYGFQIPRAMQGMLNKHRSSEFYQAFKVSLQDAVADKLASIEDEGQRMYYERLVILKALDTMWIEQVDHLQQLKSVVSGRNWGQHNPFFEYQREAIKSFDLMTKAILKQILRNLLLADLINKEDGTIDVVFP